jgi:wyosine [tRNA(Phe)-imidazoG37] synthetase (radical SAM superfamily)
VEDKQFKYLYGPVYSWRLGMSLGIDPISTPEKMCTFDCVYCQLGKTHKFESSRREFVSTEDLMDEIHRFKSGKIDYYTFSGRGEPTLAINLGDMISQIKDAGKGKVAVITNSSLLDRPDVQSDLLSADFVVAKLDCSDPYSMKKVDNPDSFIKFENIVNGIKTFKRRFSGKLALQVMFIDANKEKAFDIARIAREIGPDEVQINTPLRPCSVKPLSEKDIDKICSYFDHLNVVSVYKAEKKEYKPLDHDSTKDRHGDYK